MRHHQSVDIKASMRRPKGDLEAHSPPGRFRGSEFDDVLPAIQIEIVGADVGIDHTIQEHELGGLRVLADNHRALEVVFYTVELEYDEQAWRVRKCYDDFQKFHEEHLDGELIEFQRDHLFSGLKPWNRTNIDGPFVGMRKKLLTTFCHSVLKKYPQFDDGDKAWVRDFFDIQEEHQAHKERKTVDEMVENEMKSIYGEDGDEDEKNMTPEERLDKEEEKAVVKHEVLREYEERMGEHGWAIHHPPRHIQVRNPNSIV